MKRIKPGAVREGRIPIYDRSRNLRGHCGPRMTEASMPRFGLTHGATLGVYKGRKAWLESQQDPVALARKGRVSAVSLSKSLKAARGSVKS